MNYYNLNDLWTMTTCQQKPLVVIVHKFDCIKKKKMHVKTVFRSSAQWRDLLSSQFLLRHWLVSESAIWNNFQRKFNTTSFFLSCIFFCKKPKSLKVFFQSVKKKVVGLFWAWRIRHLRKFHVMASMTQHKNLLKKFKCFLLKGDQ